MFLKLFLNEKTTAVLVHRSEIGVNFFQEELPFMHDICAVEKVVFCDFSGFPKGILDLVNYEKCSKIWDHAI